ncbi:MAG: TRAP transporter small permease [Betaproteobacteria bacterium]|nr:TRAP transporter small permease [Betaproteobacteria bacterium]
MNSGAGRSAAIGGALGHTLGAIEAGLRVAVGMLVVMIVVLVGAQVVFRYVFKTPIVWSEEFTTLCYQWVSFLGAALAVRYRAHFGVDFVARHLERWSTWLTWVGHFVVTLIALFMIFYGFRIVESSWAQMYPTLGFSVGTGYIILPIAGVLFILMDFAVMLDRRAGAAQ